MSYTKKAVVIGTTSLCSSVLEQLAKHEWTVLAVVSNDPTVKRFCLENSIKLVNKLEQITDRDFVLFSVINYLIITDSFLHSRNVSMAINYHDSLLPRYAGVNSTTWAIYNDEPTHGVSWHLITQGIDEGKLLKQTTVSLDPRETALSLNLKCFEAAIRTFSLLLDDFDTGTLDAVEQDMTKRSYYGKEHLPDNYGILQFTDGRKKIDRLHRSLSLQLPNPVATAKIWDGRNFYLFESLEFIDCADPVPGKVYSVSDHECTVGIADSLLSIKNLMNLDGTLVWLSETDIKTGALLCPYIATSDELTVIATVKKQESKVLQAMKASYAKNNSFFPKPLQQNDAHYCVSVKASLSHTSALFKIALVLCKLSNQELVVSLVKRSQSPHIRQESFLQIDPILQESSYGEFLERLQRQVGTTQSFTKDFFYRYQVDIEQEIVINGPSSRLSIDISDEHITLHGFQQDKILLNSVAMALEAVVTQDIEQSTLVKDIRVIPDSEYNKIYHTWNQTHGIYPTQKTVHELFQDQAAKTPDAIAIVCNDRSLTYKELNAQSNQLARFIRNEYARIAGKPLKSGTLIPICLDRSIEMVIALLAIMKAGGAYVPIATSYPQDRKDYILKDTHALFSITSELDVQSESDENLEPHATSNDLAYCIYTSGTTGNPKGVLIEHSSVINMIWGLKDVYPFSTTHKKLGCFCSYVFDVSVSEIFSSLLRGGELHLFDEEHRQSVELISKYINDKKINYIYLPPAVLGLLPKIEYPSLQAIVFAGEPCDQSVGAYWAARHTLYNYYGPTECTVYATGKRVDTRNVNEIGKPLQNKKAYILDRYLNIVPVGITGELYIGGFGQARGYLHLPELTRERFIDNPFEPQTKLYKTGDLVRWLPDGNIEYIGRNDFQVKIRGHRVEPGEIERLLSDYPHISQSVVLVKEQVAGHKSLVGFFVADIQIDIMKMREHLQSKLPAYMIPDAFVQCHTFPTTVTGKLDRTALLSMQVIDEKRHIEAPVSKIEKEMLALWSECLKTNNLSIDDGFFQVGGNSLLAMSLQSKLNALYSLNLSIITLFQYPTIRTLAAHIAGTVTNEPEAVQDVPPSSQDIAIIGMSVRAPGANSVQQFWHNLANGVESICDVSDELLNESELKDAKFVKRAANIDDYLGFDAEFFGFTPREAASMDPQHRHFMEVAYEALEDSGYSANGHDLQIGLFAGQGETSYYNEQVSTDKSLEEDLGDFQLKINNDKDFLTTKISYKLNLRGPSLDIQTACSTSLVAVHVAVSQLLAGDCDIAVAGGVSIRERRGYSYKKGMIESSDGRCRAFDKEADGTVISSGVGAIVLKPLAKALKDGDLIHAVLKGVAINNDGGAFKVGYTAPSVQGQMKVIKRALQKASVDASTISYIETHGTGTKIGDPIELAALHEVFSENKKKSTSVAIGSLKTNIGHTDAAAGVLGLIKAVLALKNQQIPASLHFTGWNPEIDRFNKIFYVNRTLAIWPQVENRPRRASVSSFGIGGTNAHAILEEAPKQKESLSKRPMQLCLFSAKTEEAVKRSAQKFIMAEDLSNLAEIAYTQHVARKAEQYRSFVVSSSIDELKQHLGSIRMIKKADSSDVIFLCTGQGSQYVNMAKEIYSLEPTFSSVVDDCLRILKEKAELDLAPILFGEDEELLKRTENTQPALFVIEYAMSMLLIQLGVKPKACLGHSIGEYVAATIAGVFTLEDALILVATRGKLMQKAESGAMLSLQLSQEELLTLLPPNLDLAAVNGPNLCVVSGTVEDIALFSSELNDSKIEYTQLHTSHAFHSRMMLPILQEFKKALDAVKKSDPQIPLISNVTGTFLTNDQAKSSTYWCNHLRLPVLFLQGIQSLTEKFPEGVFVEVGPGRTLTTLSKLAKPDVIACSTLRHPKQKETDYAQFLQALGTFWQNGIEIDWKEFHQDESLRLASLPTYCFDHKEYGKKSQKAEKVEVKVEEDMSDLGDIWKSVLGIDTLRATDDFFALGGHSLLATQLLSQIQAKFGIELEIRDLFQHSTLQAMQELLSKGVHTSATNQQEALWMMQEINGKNFNAYNEPLLFEVTGEFSLGKLKKALTTVVERHEILRTVFDKDVNQIILPKVEIEIGQDDSPERPFDLSQGPLFRVTARNVGEQKWQILMVFHHIIMDGASLRIFCRELSEAYNGHTLAPVKAQYREYASWQKELFTQERYQRHLAYWKDRLSGYQELNLTQNRPRSSLFSYKGGKEQFSYGPELSSKLAALAKQERTTLFNVFLTCFGVLLSRYCRQEDILIGAPMLNRPEKRFHDMLGFFTNTVVLRNTINNDLSFRELLQVVKENTLSAYEHQEAAFDHVVSHLNIERDASRNPLVQVLLLVVNKSSRAELALKDAEVLQLNPPRHPIAKFDLSLAAFEEDEGISGYFEYSSDVFEPETIVYMAKHLEGLFTKVVQNLDAPLKTLNMMDEKDEDRLLVDWNPQYRKPPITHTLHEAFTETATKYPDKVAIKFGTAALTYRELDARSNQLAHLIKSKQPTASLVAICVEPSLDTIVAILAVLKTGAAYVPIDPNYPTDRIHDIISDSQAPLVIVQERMIERIPPHEILDSAVQDAKAMQYLESESLLVGAEHSQKVKAAPTKSDYGSRGCVDLASSTAESRIIIIDSEGLLEGMPTTGLDITYHPKDLAYVIYTSGSTGKPKGVLIPHKNVLDLFFAGNYHYQFTSDDMWVLFHSFAFDVSVWEIWGTFLYGGTLVIVSYQMTRDPEAFYELSKREKITVLNQTPSAFRNYVDVDVRAKEKISTLRYVIFAGEALNIEMLRDWWRSHDDRWPLMVNMYGITETTVHTTYQELAFTDLAECRHGRVGVPLNHLRGYVLDEQRCLCPVGVPGELYVGGGGVAYGYLNKDELTRARFIKNPFAKRADLDEDDILYKSGDLVRWMPDGTLEYIGRTDFQVKLRGFRIELGEIESVVTKYPSIKQSTVLMREENGNKYLACYFTLHAEAHAVSIEDLRAHLAKSLPEYMVPSAFVKLDAMPLTVNGKLNRALLPKPDLSVMGGHYSAPTNELERQIVKIWAELLHIDAEKISVTANYFQLGGNSLSILNMITQVKALAGQDLPLSSFWKSPTIRSIAKVIDSKEGAEQMSHLKELLIGDLILPEAIKALPTQYKKPKNVLLTGATGFLGSYLLQELLAQECDVYCLVRAGSRLQTNQKNIHVIYGDLTQANLGIDPELYKSLASTVDAVYHNGALVHHLYDYEHMRSANVSSTHEILKFATTGILKSVHFISTISVEGFDVRHKLQSDAPWTFLELNGYLLTKWVSEQLIIQAASRGVQAYIYRPGNITGHSETGHCLPEYNHTLRKVKGFIELGRAYIDDEELFEMVPVDILAKDIVQKSFNPTHEVVFNLDNPIKITFAQYLQKFLDANYAISKIESLSEWRQTLKTLNEENPLYLLRAFYEHDIKQHLPKAESDLSHALPEYEKLIAKQIEYLQTTGYIQRVGNEK